MCAAPAEPAFSTRKIIIEKNKNLAGVFSGLAELLDRMTAGFLLSSF
jgi:hypothetical protein